MTEEELEKKAEEAGNKKIKENNQFARCARKSYKDGFKDGAEFGYNKCFEQIKKLVNESTRLDCIIPELLRLQETEDV